MKTLLVTTLFIAVIFGIWWMFFKEKAGVKNTKEEPVKVLNHSSEFNNSVSTVMSSYFDIASAFVNADTSKIKEHNKKFVTVIDSLKLSGVKNDTAIYQSASMLMSDIKANAVAILSETDLTEMIS
jgi:hypothetical protein